MKHLFVACLCAGLAMVAGMAEAGAVDVDFVNPETFTDARDQNRDTAANLQILAEYLHSLGQTYLPTGQILHVDVLNVDLAGKLRPSRRWGLVRVVGAPLDWPQITLRYRLEEQGKVLASGEETISDMGYTMHLGSYPGWEELWPEKTMLRDWFRSRFSQK